VGGLVVDRSEGAVTAPGAAAAHAESAQSATIHEQRARFREPTRVALAFLPANRMWGLTRSTARL
jgi:hypothetical protein